MANVTGEFVKDPAAVLEYKWDWKASTNGSGKSDWLAAAETIASHTITADTGITVDSSAETDTDTSVTVWLSGGTHEADYTVRCAIVTDAGRKDTRKMVFKCRER